jgi:hypothetical protein
MGRAVSAISAALVLVACTQHSEQQSNTPEERLTAQAEERVRSTLRDPVSAQFEAVKAFPDEQFVCGTVNAKNAFGGYVGRTAYFVDTSNGQVHVADSCDATCFVGHWMIGRTVNHLTNVCAVPLIKLEGRCTELHPIALECGANPYAMGAPDAPALAACKKFVRDLYQEKCGA